MFSFKFGRNTQIVPTAAPARLEILVDKEAAHTYSTALVANGEQQSAMESFSRCLEDLKQAIARNRHAKELLDSFRNKGTLSSVFHSFTGRNDEELANMVEDLGSSLGTTQSVVQLLIQIQTAKNTHLRRFHSALVDKISAIKLDTGTLEQNQRDAAVFLLEEIDKYIGEQIANTDTLDRHGKKIDAIADELLNLSTQLGALQDHEQVFDKAIGDLGEALESEMAQQKKRVDELTTTLQALQRATRENEQASGRAVDNLRAASDSHSRTLRGHVEEAATTRASQAEQITRLETENAALTQQVDQLRDGLTALGKRQSLLLKVQAVVLLLAGGGAVFAAQLLYR
ncbi:hypothetical protein [Cupriavidus oxalaticus]|uniref:hypothetical protein n=1 Tax=Cupriavidus oxalaticus TaxID=96344 RepID=UPI0031808CA5